MNGKVEATSKDAHKLRLLLVLTLVILTIQGWFGDTTNLFVIPANGFTVSGSAMSAFYSAINSHGFILQWHAYEGILLFLLSIVVLAFSFVWSKKRSVRITAILATFTIFSAALGGFLFVLSGFSNGGNSAQMGGSFIGSYAFYFIELYFTK